MARPAPKRRIQGFWNGAEGQMFAVGTGGLAIAGQAGRFTRIPGPSEPVALYAAWGTDLGSMWVGGNGNLGGVLYRYDGAWRDRSEDLAALLGRDVDPPHRRAELNRLWGRADGQLWVGATHLVSGFGVGDGASDGSFGKMEVIRKPRHQLLHFDGATWSKVAEGEGRAKHLAGLSTGVVQFASDQAVQLWDGHRWNAQFLQGGDTQCRFATSPEGTLWCAAGGTIGRRRLSAWVQGGWAFSGEWEQPVDLRFALALGADDDGWLVAADHTVQHYDGRRWSAPSPLPNAPAFTGDPRENCAAIGALSSSDVWAAVGSTLYYFDGRWRRLPDPDGI